MSPAEVIRFAVAGVLVNRLRSLLTVLGILIGVAAVIVLVAVGNGSAREVQNSLSSLGTNRILVLAGGRGGPESAADDSESNTGTDIRRAELTVGDALALSDPDAAPSVKSASPVVEADVSCTHAGSSTSTSITGTWPSYFSASNSPVSSGSYFENADVLASRKVAVIGRTVAEELFGSGDAVGQEINCDGMILRVVGVQAEKGSSGFMDADNTIIAPLSVVQQGLSGYGALTSITIEARSAAVQTAAQDEVATVLDERHGIGEGDAADYEILNQAALTTAASDTTEVFTILLGAVAAISLLVGGIGITNIMLVTVTERTREIGIRKALGARRPAIVGQFMAEATILSLIGGLLGVVAGLALSGLEIAGVAPVVVPASVGLAFGVSVLIGLVFGTYPARRAAALNPIEALRYE